MRISISTVHVTVDDPDKALAFYRDALGFQVEREIERDGLRWVTLIPSGQPDVRVVLSQPHGGRSPDSGDALAALLAKGDLSPLHLRVDDLETAFAKATSAPGAEALQEPEDRFWGVRDAAVRDPAGNLLRIEQA